MDQQQADSYLAQWAAWSCEDLRSLGYATSRWQHEIASGRRKHAEIQPGPDDIMELVDRVVTHVCRRSPAMGEILKQRYRQRLTVRRKKLNGALQCFINPWCEIQ